MTDLRFLDPTGLVNRAAFNERFEQLNSAAFVGEDGLEDINGNGVGTKIYTGSYVGTGTYGSSNPNTLTFPFEPKILVVGNYWQFTAPYGCPSAPCMGSGNSVGGVNLNWSGNSVSWHSTRNDTQQLNESGKTYYYLTIG